MIVTSQDSRGSGTGALLVLGSCLSLQFGAALAIRLFPSLGVWGVTTLRLGMAAAILMAASRPDVVRWSRSQWQSVAVFGIIMVGMNGSFYLAIERIPLSAAVAIEFVGPLLLSAVLSRRAIDLAWVLLAMLGIGLLGIESVTQTESLDPLGVLFAVIAGAFWALYIVSSAHVGQRVPGTGGLAIALAIATVVVAPLGMSGVTVAVDHPALLLPALGVALLCSAIPYTLELAALRRLPRSVFGILLSLEPIIAVLSGWLFLGQTAGPVRLTAIALVIAASIGTIVTAPAGVQDNRTTRSAQSAPV
ncbi:EamA family transporter [Gordonia sp. NPDC003424]